MFFLLFGAQIYCIDFHLFLIIMIFITWFSSYYSFTWFYNLTF